MEFPSNTIIAGCTRSGKTFHTKNILRKHLQDFDNVVILSPTAQLSNDWIDFEKSKNISIFTEPNIFHEIIDELTSSLENLKQISNKKKYKRSPNVLLIIDDCLGHKILLNGSPLDKVSTKSRHFNLSIIILSQKLKGIPRTFRLNSRYILFFSCVNFDEMLTIMSEYLPKQYKKRFFQSIEKIYEKPYTFIQSDNFSNNFKERLFLNGNVNLLDII